MSQSPLNKRIEDLERRLAAVEDALGAQAAAARQGNLSGLRTEPPVGRTSLAESSPPALLVPDVPSTSEDRSHEALPPVCAPQADAEAASPTADMGWTSGSTSLFGAAAPAPRERPAVSLEAMIGGRGLPIAGAIAFIIGVGFLVTLAVRDGWFGRLPPMLKCGAGAALGVGLLIGAAIVARRVNRWAASGLNAAGLGALYVSAWAAWALYALVDPPVAFALLGGCAGLGLFIAARSGFMEVAVVALIGGYLAPLLVGERDADPIVMPAYLLSLLVVGLGLSWRLGGSFAALRTLTLVATVVLGSFWALNGVPSSARIAMGFLAAVWAAFHAEMILSARREDLRSPAPVAATEDEEQAARAVWESAGVDRGTAVPVVSSFGLTAWAALLGVWTIKRIDPGGDWSVTGGLAVAAVLVSLVLAGHLRFLVDRPGSRQEKLGAALAAQAGGLIAATIALGIGGWMQLCAWAAVGAAAGLAARWVGSRALGWYGAALLAVASCRLLVVEAFDPALSGAGVDVFGLYLTRWALLAAGCAAAWSLLAVMAAGSGLSRSLGVLAMSAAIVSWLVVPAHQSAQGASIGLAWLALGVVGVALSRPLRTPGLLFQGGFAIVVASTLLVSWGWNYAGRAPAIDVLGVAVSKWTGLAVAASACWVVLALVAAARRYPPTSPSDGRGVVGAACAVAAVALALAPVHPGTDLGSLTLVWIGLGVLVAALQPLVPALWPARAGAGLITASSGAWLFAFVLDGRWLDHAWPLWMHPGLLIAAMLGAALLGVVWWWGRFERAAVDWLAGDAIARWLVAMLMFISTSHEAARVGGRLAADPTAQAATLTIWWAIFATGLLAVGFIRRAAAARWVGLAVLGAAVFKAVAFDMSGVALAWRVVVFLALGVLMLGIAMVYARLQRVAPAVEGERM